MFHRSRASDIDVPSLPSGPGQPPGQAREVASFFHQRSLVALSVMRTELPALAPIQRAAAYVLSCCTRPSLASVTGTVICGSWSWV